MKKTFILTDAIANNNKFWEYTITNNTIEYKWGRVGTTGQSKTTTSSNPEQEAESKANSKIKKGYKPVDIISSSHTSSPTASHSSHIIKNEAFKQFCPDGTNPILATLVEKLVKANKHEIVTSTGGMMNVDVTTGIISTAVGVVTKDSIIDARSRLNVMIPYIQSQQWDDKAFISNLNEYLMKVPQKVSSSRGWHRQFIYDTSTIDKQFTLLDQLESSVDLAMSRITNYTPVDNASDTPSLFDAEIKLCTDNDVINQVEKLFFNTLSHNHVSSRLKPKHIYEIRIPTMDIAFTEHGAKLHNIQRLWHGTRVFNVLSILKNGLIIPPTRGGTYQIAGRMFGNGIYTAISSSKSLNYSFGFWDNGVKDNNCFMFLCDVAMGNYYTPKSSSESLPKKGFDSTWAKPGISGIQNDEIIVYNTSQCNIQYLVEFGV